MCKRAMYLLLALITVPSFATAATYWQITATTSPAALKTNLTAARPANFGNYTTPGGAAMSLTKVTRTPYNTVSFDVAAVPGKTVIVKVDGVQAGTSSGPYNVAKGTKLSHTIAAYYSSVTYTLTAQSASGGTISPSATYSANPGVVTVTPFTGNVLSGLKIGTTTYALADPLPADITMSGDASGATYTFTSGSYTLQGVFTAAPVAKAVISTPSMTVATGATGILIDGSSSSSNVAGTTYNWETTCGVLTPVSPADDKIILFAAPVTVGTCTVTLTVTAAGVTPSPTATVNITTQSAKLVATQVCLDCHNGTAGPVVPGDFATNLHNGQASCTDCHNANNTSSHSYNTKLVMANSCTPCHSQLTTSTVSVAWNNGAHGTASGHTTGTCQRCHANEGAIVGAEVGWTGSYTNVLLPYTSTVWRNNKPAASSNGISCAVCHDPHTGLRAINTIVAGTVVPWDPNQNSQNNDQFDVCTSCHSLLDNSGALVGNYHDGGSINVTRTISDSHYDNPATGVGLTTNVVEGYVIRVASANPCADCHNLHKADLTAQEAWAKSAHAGKIATKKDDAACTESLNWFNATYPSDLATACTDSKIIGTSTRTVLEFFQRNATGVAFYKTTGAIDDAAGNAWTHYNWDQTSSRGACQRCHTATGIANFLDSPSTYNATGVNNNFSHLSGWTAAAGSPQQELLYCWGCHSDSQTGALRNPGAITEVYAGTPAVTVSYPNIDKSNVCMGCHLGRETGAIVKASTLDFSNLSFINSHYLAAGSTLFNESGYEYDGQSYDTFGYHKNVGIANSYNTGTAGPCVTCHMTSAEGHSFDVFTKDTTGAITSVASTQCVNCHGGLTPAALEGSKHEFHLAMEELKAALGAKGIVFYPAHPYFYRDLNANGMYDAATESGSGNAFKNWDAVYSGKGKEVMGAAFNYNLFEHDPGAYAHNRGYALKLIQDSIDFLADGVVDGAGISAAFTAAANNKEFTETTSHPAAITAAADATNCATCHVPAPHYGGAFNSGNAQFVANNASCSDCHSGGSTTANGTILAQYAESGHGAVDGAAWKTSSSHDWPNATTCRDCHSTTGFTAKVGGTARTPVVAGAGQTLACDACHTDLATGGTVRPVTQVTVAYKTRTYDATNSVWNPAAPAVFPDGATQNNICITCHAGRESGESILALSDTGMNNVSFKNPHYLGAAGMMYAKLAFIDFTDRATPTGSTSTINYGLSLTANEDGGKLTSTHRKLGTVAINGDSHNPVKFISGFQDSAGPCVTCHMGDVKDHTWDINANAFNNVCFNCHTEEAGTPLTADNFKTLFLEEQAVPFNNAVDLAIATLKTKFNISYTEAYPYFYDDSLATPAAAKDWTRAAFLTTPLSAADAKKLMGACLNIKLMKADPAAYVHSRTYARRVLYDTIDWLDNMTIDMSVTATAVVWDPATYVIGADANPPSSESVLYLKGYNRTTKAWNALERP